MDLCDKAKAEEELHISPPFSRDLFSPPSFLTSVSFLRYQMGVWSIGSSVSIRPQGSPPAPKAKTLSSDVAGRGILVAQLRTVRRAIGLGELPQRKKVARTQFTLLPPSPPAIKDTAEKEGHVNTHLWLRSLFFLPRLCTVFQLENWVWAKRKRQSGARIFFAKNGAETRLYVRSKNLNTKLCGGVKVESVLLGFVTQKYLLPAPPGPGRRLFLNRSKYCV